MINPKFQDDYLCNKNLKVDVVGEEKKWHEIKPKIKIKNQRKSEGRCSGGWEKAIPNQTKNQTKMVDVVGDDKKRHQFKPKIKLEIKPKIKQISEGRCRSARWETRP